MSGQDQTAPRRGPGRPRKHVSPQANQDAVEDSTPRKSKRPKRTPIAESRNILSLKNAPKGYKYRWVQDDQDRILRFREAGYEHVYDSKGLLQIGDREVEADRQLGSIVSKITGTNSKTREKRVDYLMAIREDWYNEDQQAKELALKESVQELDDKARDAGLEGTGTQFI